MILIIEVMLCQSCASSKPILSSSSLPGQRVDLSSGEVGVHVVGALLKDLLRSVPGGILQSNRYTEFVATNDQSNMKARVVQVKRCVRGRGCLCVWVRGVCMWGGVYLRACLHTCMYTYVRACVHLCG